MSFVHLYISVYNNFHWHIVMSSSAECRINEQSQSSIFLRYTYLLITTHELPKAARRSFCVNCIIFFICFAIQYTELLKLQIKLL